MLLLFHRFDFSMVGITTLVATLINAPLIGLFGKALDRIMVFDSIHPPMKAGFNKIFN